jgi:hypothetical protein
MPFSDVGPEGEYLKAKQEKGEEAATKLFFERAGRLSQVYRKLETCGKPFAIAINGTCLGGAFELALACHYRVIADDDKARVGLPEIKVGLFPGAGGTQRVARLMPTGDALQMLFKGEQIRLSRQLVALRLDVPINFAEIYEKRTPTRVSQFDDNCLDLAARNIETPPVELAILETGLAAKMGATVRYASLDGDVTDYGKSQKNLDEQQYFGFTGAGVAAFPDAARAVLSEAVSEADASEGLFTTLLDRFQRILRVFDDVRVLPPGSSCRHSQYKNSSRQLHMVPCFFTGSG